MRRIRVVVQALALTSLLACATDDGALAGSEGSACRDDGTCDTGLVCSASRTCVAEPAIDPCSGVACAGHGFCAVAAGAAVCVCDPGHHAEELECIADVDPCDGVACSGHGVCAVSEGAALCVCDDDYHAQGLECLADADPCAGVACSGHGTCVVSGVTASCDCDADHHAEGLECVADNPGTPAPTVDVTADPTTVESGGTTTITWSTTDATSCIASDAWSGDKATSGSEVIPSLDATSTFTLTCDGPGGSTADSVIVRLSAPGLLFRLTPENLGDGFNTYRGPDDGTNVWDAEYIEDFTRFYRWADVSGDPQTGFGFNPNELLPVPFATLAPGPFYLRFRMRVVQPLGNGGHSAGMKWFIFGGPGISGERRMIMFIRNGSAGGGTNEAHTTIDPTAGVSGNHAAALVPNGQWVNVQIAWKYEAGPYMRVYVDNNDEGSPDAEHTSFAADAMGGAWLYPEAWDTGFWGNIVTTSSTTDVDAVMDFKDVELGTVFDSSWASP